MAAQLTVLSGPAAEPVSLDEAKDQLQTDLDDADGLLGLYITAARGLVEEYTGRTLTTKQLRLTLDTWREEGYARWECWADDALILLDGPPVQSIDAVRYYDSAGDQQTLATTAYALSLGRLCPAPAATWPTLQSGRAGAVEIDYTAGYGQPEDVPAGLPAAILLLVGHWFLHREAVGQPMSEQPLGVRSLCSSFWTGRYR